MALKLRLWFVSVASWIVLAACGGGGDAGSTSSTSPTMASATVGAAGGTVATGDSMATAVFPANEIGRAHV